MAQWKKVVVSGSSPEFTALQVDNLVSGQVVIGGGNASNLSSTPINGTGNILATTGATSVSISGSFSGSFQGDGSGLNGISASFLANALSQGSGIVPFNFDGTAARTVAVSGAAQLTNNLIVKWNSADGKFVNSSITDNGSVLSGASSIQLTGASSVLTGSFTGSFAGDGSNLTGIATVLAVSGSTGDGTVNLKTQALTIAGTVNEIETSVAGQTVTIGLPNDVTIAGDLVVNNDLTVLGTASFQNTVNLEVADRFILLASGSNSAGDGGLVVQQGTQNVGELFAFDSGTTRWAFTGSFNAASSSFTPDAFVAAALIGAGTDPTAVASRYQVGGNIFIGTDQEIWIYS
jgi:hypothetical protein